MLIPRQSASVKFLIFGSNIFRTELILEIIILRVLSRARDSAPYQFEMTLPLENYRRISIQSIEEQRDLKATRKLVLD